MSKLTPSSRVRVGRFVSGVGFLLWMAYAILWAYLDGHRPHVRDAAHPFEYPGHTGAFYLANGDFVVLNTLMGFAIILFIGGGLAARRGARRQRTPWQLP